LVSITRQMTRMEGELKGKRILGRRTRRWDMGMALDVKINRMGGRGVNTCVSEW